MTRTLLEGTQAAPGVGGAVRHQESSNLRKHTSPNPVQRWLVGRFHRQVGALVARALQETPADTRPLVLDIGCGEGFATRALAGMLPWVHLVGIDVRREALVVAQHPHHPGPAGLLQADAVRLPLRDGAAGLVVCLEVLEHLHDPWAALEELRRVSSGYLVVSVPDQPLFSIANFLRGKNVRRLGEDPEHLWHWRGETFLRLLKRRCEVVERVRSFPWVLALARA